MVPTPTPYHFKSVWIMAGLAGALLLALATGARDAVSATTRMLGTLALPPSSQDGQASADAQEPRSEIESRLNAIKTDAPGAESGNLAAVGNLLTDLTRDQSAGTQLANELRHLIKADLGLSLAETHACRALVGSPI